MPKIVKPSNINKIWSQNGDNTSPTDNKINLGWISEVPPRQTFNYLDNKQDQAIAAFNQSGIPEWDSVTEYQGNFSYVLGSNGLVYKAKTTNVNVNPVTDTGFSTWGLAIVSPDGTIPFIGQAVLVNGTAATPAIAFTNALATGLYADATSKALSISVAGLEKVRFNQSSTDFKATVNLQAISTGVTPTAGDSSTKIATTEFVQGAVANAASAVIPAGAVMAFAMQVEPAGWLFAHGQAVSRTVYANLFAAIGTLYGAGNGTTTFNLPDYRAEHLRGVDAGRGIDTGRSIGSSQGQSIQSHTHIGTAAANGAHRHDFKSPSGDQFYVINDLNSVPPAEDIADGAFRAQGPSDGNDARWYPWTSTAGSHSHTISIQATGGAETRPRNVAVNYCIKF